MARSLCDFSHGLLALLVVGGTILGSSGRARARGLCLDNTPTKSTFYFELRRSTKKTTQQVCDFALDALHTGLIDFDFYTLGVHVQNRTRTDNDESRDELDKIFQAINERKQISYSYFDYDLRKQRKYRYKEDIKCISPWAVIYDNNFYYLLAYDGKKMRVYRIDHMEGVEVEEAEAEGLEEFKKIKLSDYTKQTFGMYSGELQSVTMRFPNNMVGTVLDRFGREVTLMKADDRHFRITVPIAVSPQFYGWVFGLKNMVTIESPQSVVDGMKEMLAAVEKRYEDPKGLQ